MQRQGPALNDMAILVRASFQMRAFEDRFICSAVPYRVIGGPRFYERPRSATPWPICARRPRRRPRLRAHRQHAEARHRRHRPSRSMHEHTPAPAVGALHGGRRCVSRDRRLSQGAHALRRCRISFDRWRRRAQACPIPSCRDRARGERLYRHVAEGQDRPTGAGGSKTSRSWSAPWQSSSRPCPPSSSISRWSWTPTAAARTTRSRS
jgi:DNA helicase-2/ATP-dependent DNA helicase PcrA